VIRLQLQAAPFYWNSTGLFIDQMPIKQTKLLDIRRPQVLIKTILCDVEHTPDGKKRKIRMLNVGIIGWRGMVGSVLMERMLAEDDFGHIEPLFFSTSQAGQPGPTIKGRTSMVQDAYDLKLLTNMDILVSCQGGGYTERTYGQLRDGGWSGYWIDAASTRRMLPTSVIILDPVNRHVIDQALADGIKDFIGGNCTVSLMLMALGGLFEHDLIEWMTSMTYQSASGAGAKNMRELVSQMQTVGLQSRHLLENPATAILEIDRQVHQSLQHPDFPKEHFGVPLAASCIPWIDRPMDNGQTREEWKGYVETNKILGRSDRPVPIDGLCVRIGSMRCHSQAVTIKLTKEIPLTEVERIIQAHNDWVKVVPNDKSVTMNELTPAKVSGSLSVPIGRIRNLNIGPQYMAAFTVGDQLLWGAAEPLRRMLRILIDRL
jgi:aspartate-semialdehyde dehydrogenase